MQLACITYKNINEKREVGKDILGERMREDIYKISKMQHDLDKVVFARFPELRQKNSIVWKMNALVVEMAECLQEWKGFKVWKREQTPNWKEMKEEYADWFHFVISIGLEFGIEFREMGINPKHYYTCYLRNIKSAMEQTEALNEMIFEWNMKLFRGIKKNALGTYTMSQEDYRSVLGMFIAIGKVFGFTWEDIYGAYVTKNKTNFKRQASGY